MLSESTSRVSTIDFLRQQYRLAILDKEQWLQNIKDLQVCLCILDAIGHKTVEWTAHLPCQVERQNAMTARKQLTSLNEDLTSRCSELVQEKSDLLQKCAEFQRELTRQSTSSVSQPKVNVYTKVKCRQKPPQAHYRSMAIYGKPYFGRTFNSPKQTSGDHMWTLS